MKIQPGLDDQGQKVARLPWELKHLTYQEERKSTETLLVVASERRQAISVRSRAQATDLICPRPSLHLVCPREEPRSSLGKPKWTSGKRAGRQDPAPLGPIAKVVSGLAKAQTIAWNS